MPKGHLDPGESEEQAAVREAFEETGIRGELGALVSRIEYLVFTKKGGQRLKQVAFFLLRADTPDFTLQADEGIHVADWLSPDAALAQVGYSQVHDVLAQALSML